MGAAVRHAAPICLFTIPLPQPAKVDVQLRQRGQCHEVWSIRCTEFAFTTYNKTLDYLILIGLRAGV